MSWRIFHQGFVDFTLLMACHPSSSAREVSYFHFFLKVLKTVSLFERIFLYTIPL